jgi:hypothetical protein
VLVRRFAVERWAAAGSAILPLVLLVAVPFHYGSDPTPVRDGYERLQPVIPAAGPEPVLLSRGFSASLCDYLLPRQGCEGKPIPLDVAARGSGRQFAAALDREGATVLYADERTSRYPAVAAFLADPRGWSEVNAGSSPAGDWAVLVRDRP